MSIYEPHQISSRAAWLQTGHEHNPPQLTDEEVLEYFNLQVAESAAWRSKDYAQLIAAMYTFVPYLEQRPQLIPAFVEAVYNSIRGVFTGPNDPDGFFSFLESKAYVDDKLNAALKQHRPEFEAALSRLIAQN